jgi:hypothetical protein
VTVLEGPAFPPPRWPGGAARATETAICGRTIVHRARGQAVAVRRVARAVERGGIDAAGNYGHGAEAGNKRLGATARFLFWR